MAAWLAPHTLSLILLVQVCSAADVCHCAKSIGVEAGGEPPLPCRAPSHGSMRKAPIAGALGPSGVELAIETMTWPGPISSGRRTTRTLPVTKHRSFQV